MTQRKTFLFTNFFAIKKGHPPPTTFVCLLFDFIHQPSFALIVLLQKIMHFQIFFYLIAGWL